MAANSSADTPKIAAPLNNLGLLYRQEGRYAEAEPLHFRALTITTKAYGKDSREVAITLNCLATLFMAEERYSEAEPVYRRSLEVRRKLLPPNHPDIGTALNNLAAVYREEGKYAEAEPLQQQALEVDQKAWGGEHPVVAIDLSNLAELKRAQGKNAEAESTLSQALAIEEKSLGPDHPDISETATRLAGLYYSEGKYLQAAPLLERAFKNLTHQFQYNFTYMSEQDKLRFLETVRGVFTLYLSFCFQYRDRLPDAASTMYDLVLLQKGLVAESVASFRARVAATGDVQAIQLLNQITGLRAEVARLRADPASITPDSRGKADQIEKEANRAERELVKLSSAAAERSRISNVTWHDVQKSLSPGEAAVEFVRFIQEDGVRRTGAAPYVALVLTSANASPALVYLGDAAEIETNVLQDYWQRIEGTEVPGSGARFYQKLWKPLEPKLAGATRVYVSPDGLLNQISLAAVPTDRGNLLIEAFDVRVVLSTKDLLRGKHPAATRTAVLIGDPRFDLSEAEQRAAMASQNHADHGDATRKAQFKTTSATLSRSAEDAQRTLPRLPATGDEVRSIGKLMETSGWRVEIATGSSALKQTIEQVNGPRVLHVATHGFFNRPTTIRIGDSEQGEDAMLHSGLFFAGANRALRGAASPDDLDDGILTAYEATSLNLQGTELVVLSACETGLGESFTGEGVFGLRRALQEAGAQTILMSMWKVPDAETQILMTSFYKKWLSGMDKHAALTEAQLELRKDVMNRWQEDRPHDWAAFVLVGP